MLPLLLLWFGLFHDFHNSIAEVHYNPSNTSLEVSMRVFADDLTLALNHERNKEWKEEDLLKPENQKSLEVYFVKHFALVSANKEVKAQNFVGIELERDVFWVYLEFKNSKKLEGYTLLNSVLMEQFDDQTNIVNIFYPTWKSSILFNGKKRLAPMPQEQ